MGGYAKEYRSFSTTRAALFTEELTVIVSPFIDSLSGAVSAGTVRLCFIFASCSKLFLTLL